MTSLSCKKVLPASFICLFDAVIPNLHSGKINLFTLKVSPDINKFVASTKKNKNLPRSQNHVIHKTCRRREGLMSINNEIQGHEIQGHEINQINEISQISDPNDINNETQHGQEGVPETQNEMQSDLQDLNQTNGMPPFPQNFQPQDFQPQHPGQHMMWNNQFMPPQMGRPNGPPFPFGIPSPFAPYQNFPAYRMKPPEMGSFYHDGIRFATHLFFTFIHLY